MNPTTSVLEDKEIEPYYDQNSKSCCHYSCSRCYGPAKSECILTLDSKTCTQGEPRSCTNTDANGKKRYMQYYGGLDRCGLNDQFTKEVSTSADSLDWKITGKSQAIFTGKIWLFKNWDSEKIKIVIKGVKNKIESELSSMEFPGR